MELTKEQIESLARFALDILDEFPDLGTFDGGDIQDTAVKHNILVPQIVYTPCGEDCNCAEYYGEEEWQDGVTCYHIADWLDRAAELKRAPVRSEQNVAYCTSHVAPVVNGYCFECGLPRSPRSTRSEGG